MPCAMQELQLMGLIKVFGEYWIMEMNLVFLGTSGTTPTKDRNFSSVALNFKGNWLLFDCGEGTQRQMVKAKVSYMRINHVFISHFHADHILGLPGLFATMALHQRDYPLYVHGPRGVKDVVRKCLELPNLKPNFEIICKEVKNGVVVNEKDYTVKAAEVVHSAPCVAYIFEESGKAGTFQRETAIKLGVPVGPLFRKLQEGKSVKVGKKIIKPNQVMDYSKGRAGRKIAYVTDTLPKGRYKQALKKVDMLVHEATFLEKEKERASETYHCTAKQAAEIAERAEVKQLFLTHFSSREKDASKFENEARMVFPNSAAAKDLQVIKI